MKAIQSIDKKIVDLPELKRRISQWRLLNKTIAFTNGCFDILHEGHIASLMEAAQLADYLIVGVNADSSVKRLKGEQRPLNNQQARSLVLASLSIVDAVVVFEEDTPRQLIATLLPDFLVKGGDYKVADIAGSQEVLAAGGKVIINPLVPNVSTTGLIEKMKDKSEC